MLRSCVRAYGSSNHFRPSFESSWCFSLNFAPGYMAQKPCGRPGYTSSFVGTLASCQTCSITRVQSRTGSNPHAWKYVLGRPEWSG